MKIGLRILLFTNTMGMKRNQKPGPRLRAKRNQDVLADGHSQRKHKQIHTQTAKHLPACLAPVSSVKTLRRLVAMVWVFVFLFGILCVSTFWRMFCYDRAELESLAMQYYSDVYYYYPRGLIVDRNGIALNYGLKSLADQQVPSYQQRIATNVLGEVSIDERNTTAEGFQALSGLEARYDSVLNGGAPMIFSAGVDAAGNIVLPTTMTVSGEHVNQGGKVETTLDYAIQTAAQELIEQTRVEGGYDGVSILVTKTGTGEILAMASQEASLLNENLCAYSPASLCKTYVLAAALEQGVVDKDDTFSCPGKMTIDGKVCYCHDKEGHGEQSVLEAYENSCNLVFYQIAKKLSIKGDGQAQGSQFLRYILSQDTQLTGALDEVLCYEEFMSTIPQETFNQLDIFNYCLGQGNLELTPLFVNFSTDLIASGGMSMSPHLVKRVYDPAGNIIETQTGEMLSANLSEKTISVLQQGMQGVVSRGTAAGFDGASYGGFAGKTGTAETGNTEVNNGWFSGYFPKENPQYTMTVLVRGAPSSYEAVKLFDAMAKIIASLQ